MKKTFFSVFPLFSVVPLNRLKFNEVSSLQEFILLPSPFGEGQGVRLFRLQNYLSPHLPANYWYILQVFVTNGKCVGINGMKIDEWFGEMTD